MTTLRWLLLAATALLLLALTAYARGRKHHHGNDIGTHGTRIDIVVRR